MPKTVKVQVDVMLIERLFHALHDAKDTAREALDNHNVSLGSTTKKNALIAGMYAKEINILDGLTKELAEFR